MSIWEPPLASHHPPRVGFARVNLLLPSGKPLAGYGPLGSGHAAWTRSPMYARAMVVQGTNGEQAVVVVMVVMVVAVAVL